MTSSSPALPTSTSPVDRAAVIARHQRYLSPELVELLGVFGYGRVFVRAEGCHLVDDAGQRYLDLLAGFGSVPLGHNPPRLLAAVRALLDEQPLHFNHLGPALHAGLLGEALAARATGAGGALDAVLLSSSGSEAVEAAMKLARAATGRPGFVSCAEGFHGMNLGSLSIMGADRLRAPFAPLLPHCARVPFGDVDALARALRDKDVAAFVVEPLVGEGGVLLAPPGYLRQAQALCRQAGTLFVLDEVQTGLGRTGSLFHYQQHELDGPPDALVLAKALSGGIAPIAATLTTSALRKRAFGTQERFDLHSSTYQGNALGCAVALETLRAIDDDKLVDKSKAQGARLLAELRARLGNHPLVKDIRGAGLLVGIELGVHKDNASVWQRLFAGAVDAAAERVLGQWLSYQLLLRGVVVQPASQRWSVLRIEPPLTITDDELAQAIDAIAGVLGELTSASGATVDALQRIREQRSKRWAF